MLTPCLQHWCGMWGWGHVAVYTPSGWCTAQFSTLWWSESPPEAQPREQNPSAHSSGEPTQHVHMHINIHLHVIQSREYDWSLIVYVLTINRKHLEFGGSVRLHDVAKVQNKLTQQSPHFPTFHDKCLGYTGRPSLARCNTLSSNMCVLLFLLCIIN